MTHTQAVSALPSLSPSDEHARTRLHTHTHTHAHAQSCVWLAISLCCIMFPCAVNASWSHLTSISLPLTRPLSRSLSLARALARSLTLSLSLSRARALSPSLFSLSHSLTRSLSLSLSFPPSLPPSLSFCLAQAAIKAAEMYYIAGFVLTHSADSIMHVCKHSHDNGKVYAP